MKPKFRIPLLMCVTSIALVIGIFVVKQVEVCCSPNQDNVSNENATQTSISATGTELAVLLSGQISVTLTAISDTSVYDQCGWSWATRDLPDTKDAVQEALVGAGMTNVQIIRASAYGEECSNLPRDAHNFGAMSTDFYLNAEISNFDDPNESAKIITDVYNVLTHLKIELPAHPGYLEITFTSEGETKHFRADFGAIKLAIEAEKSGKELVALGEW